MSRSAARSTWPSASELAPSSVAQPAVKINGAWQLWPSEHQIPAKQYTHFRPVPLPLSIHVRINGIDCDGQYEGHGQSKVAFLLSADDSDLSGKILKLCDKVDHEPHLFAELSSTGLYPEIYSRSMCIEYGGAAQPVVKWHAWITEHVTPLDQFLKRANVIASNCILGAIRCMLVAQQHGHYLSDNALFNFGVLQNKIVILDAGSREKDVATLCRKSDFNTTCMSKFWNKIKIYVKPEDFAQWQETWRWVHSLEDARATFDALWASNADLLTGESDSAEQPVPHDVITCVPHVASILGDLAGDSLDWLLKNFLWGHISQYALLQDGTIGYQYIALSPDVKLEMLISLTHARRARVCRNVDTDVLYEDQLADVIDDWKNDYLFWMHLETLDRSWGDTHQQWHLRLRKAFRAFLFQMVGCYEMSVFFLVVPFTDFYLQVFRHSWESSKTGQEALELSKRLARKRTYRTTCFLDA